MLNEEIKLRFCEHFINLGKARFFLQRFAMKKVICLAYRLTIYVIPILIAKMKLRIQRSHECNKRQYSML